MTVYSAGAPDILESGQSSRERWGWARIQRRRDIAVSLGCSGADTPPAAGSARGRRWCLTQPALEGGQDLIEFALILPLLLLLLLGIMESGILILSYDTIANAAREGVRHGIVHPDDVAGMEAAARRLTTGLDQGAVHVTVTRPGARTIRVTVAYAHDFITAPIIQAVGGGSTVQLRTEATMIREQ